MSDFTDAVDRLDTKYNGNPYDPMTNPGGFDGGGHSVVLIPTVRDIATAANGVGSLVNTAIAGAATATDKATSATASAATATAKAAEAAASAVAAAANVNPLWLYHGISPIGIQPTFQYRPGYEDVPSIVSVVRASTATRVNEIGMIEQVANNILRIDHDPVTGECLGALVEESRTNLLTYSEQFDNAAWLKARTTVSANAAISPDGTTTADKLVDGPATDGATSHVLQQLVTMDNATQYTYSLYVKAGTRNYVALFFGGSYGAMFNVSTGEILSRSAGVTASMTPVGGGWFRCAVTHTTTTTSYYMNLFLADDSGSNSYTGDGASGLYIWGVQLESGAFPTSYIPTTTAAATRAADVVTVPVSAFPFNPLEGTLYANGSMMSVGALAALGSTISERVITSPNYAAVIDNGVASLYYDGADVQGTYFKEAIGFALNNSAYCQDGNILALSATSTIPTILRLSVFDNGANTFFFSGHFKHIAYFPKRLTNSNLQLLTA